MDARDRHGRLLMEMLALPTAPFAEQHVIAYVRRFVRDRPGLRFTQDRAGNVVVQVGPRRRRALVLAAHLDHPGFVAEQMIDARTLRARWHGGVAAEYFPAAKVRFYSDGRWIRGRIADVVMAPPDADRPSPRVESVAVQVKAAAAPGAIGMWDFPDPAIRGNRITARGCDDVAGAAAILACLDELAANHPTASLTAVLTRAEEVGFVGAIAACRLRTIPRDALVVAVECSAERPNARPGDGPILRVGDLADVFTPAATAWCRSIAERLASADRTFAYQRKLMDGGTCESTVYCEFGYAATGLCVALRNYHNMDRRRRRLAPESIDLRDWHAMVRWFVALATAERAYDGTHPGLVDRLRKTERRYRDDLRRSTAAVRAAAE